VEKKDEYRFTIRFNPADPKHQKVAEILKVAARRKAYLIADAVYEYLLRHEGDLLITPIKSIALPPTLPLPNTDQTPTDFKTADTKAFSEDGTPSSAGSYDDDMRKAVLGGLSSFKT